jgi:hypothetical protein
MGATKFGKLVNSREENLHETFGRHEFRLRLVLDE